MRDGTPLGSYLGGGGRESDYICPPAGVEGGPPGFDADATASIIRIDPHLGGPTVKLGNLTAKALAAATANAAIDTAGIDVDTWRERSADAFMAAAQMSNAIVSNLPVSGEGVVEMAPTTRRSRRDRKNHTPAVPQQPAAAPPEIAMKPVYPQSIQKQAEVVGQPVPYAPPAAPPPAMAEAWQQGPGLVMQQQPMMAPAVQQPAAPMWNAPMLGAQPIPAGGSLFNQTRQPPMQSATVPQQSASTAVQPPDIRVQFEIDGFPFQFDGYFHKVIITDTTMVLAFDDRAVGYPRQFPPMAIEQDIAVTIVGQPYVYVVAAPKHRFKFDNYEMCVVEIRHTHQIEGPVHGQARPNRGGINAGPF